MARWCSGLTCDAAIGQLAAAGIPSGPVLSPQQVLDHPQVQAMEMFSDTAYPGCADPVPLVRMPVDLDATPAAIDRRPASAGEHNDEILGALGFSAAEIARFKAGGII